MTLMAELEPDETLASIDSGESLAWSEDDSLDDPPFGSWRSVWLRAAAVLLFCVLTAVGVVWWEQPAPAGTPPAAAPSPTAVVDPGFIAQVTSTPAPAWLPPVGDAARMKPPDPDTKFLAAMDRAEVHMPTTTEAIDQGHRICGALDKGTSVQAVTEKLASLSPGVTFEQIGQVVHAAINAYCPQHETRGEY